MNKELTKKWKLVALTEDTILDQRGHIWPDNRPLALDVGKDRNTEIVDRRFTIVASSSPLDPAPILRPSAAEITSYLYLLYF